MYVHVLTTPSFPSFLSFPPSPSLPLSLLQRKSTDQELRLGGLDIPPTVQCEKKLSSCASYAMKLRRKYCSLRTAHAQRSRTCAREY